MRPGTAARRVLLSADPLTTARGLLGSGRLLTPNERAASALRGGAADSQSLAGLAEERLAGAGWQTAATVAQLTGLRRAVRETAVLDEGATALAPLGSAVRELLRAGLGRDPAVASGLLRAADLAARTKAIVVVAERYRELLAESRLVDPAEALWRAAPQDAPLGTTSLPVLVAGYPRVGLAELVFLDSVAGDGSVFVLPVGYAASEWSAAFLGERGWQLERADAATLPLVTTASFRPLRLPNQEAEVRQALSEIKQVLRDGADPRSLTLVARDEPAYGPLVAAVAAEFQVPVKLSYAVPVRSTRLGELLTGISTVLSEGLPFEATARLLAHPLLRILDGDSWAAARAAHPAGPGAWQEYAPAVALLAWPERGSLAQYRTSLQALLEEGGVNARFSERETRGWEILDGALAQYEQQSPLTLAGFLALLDELLSVLSISVDPHSKSGVEFHSPLAVFGASYEHVYLLGAVEGMLPAPLVNDPLLDFFERDLVRAHGLPLEDAVEAAERETLSFQAALLTARSTLTMSYPELLENREQLASPFFAALGTPRPLAPEPRPATSDQERLLLTLPLQPGPARHAWEVEARRESDAPPDEFDGIIGAPVDVARHSFSASQLTNLGQCSFRWFAQRRLRLAEPEEAEEDVSPALLGSIYHKTLELAARRGWDEATRAAGAAGPAAAAGWDERASATFRQAASDHLDAAFTAAQLAEGTPRAATWPLQRREHLAKLTRVIASEDFLLPQTAVVRLEDEFTGQWRGFNVRGRVDRVDDGPAGLVLTDYKTGKSRPLGAKNSKGEPKLDLQLPLYVETAAPAWFGPERPVASARYFSLNGAATLLESKIDEEELQRFVERALQVLRAGDFPVDPDEEQKVCTYCEFDAVCRRGPRLGRKRQRAERAAARAGERELGERDPASGEPDEGRT